jgi:hypothetical protein
MSELSNSSSFEPPKQSDPLSFAQVDTIVSFEKFIADNPVGRFSKVTSEAEMYRLSKHMIENCDLAAFDELKHKHCDPAQKTPAHKLKYLDLFRWLGGRMNVALMMGLHKSMPLSILDVGTGAGHFPFIAKYFGHSLVTTDIPDGSPEGNLKNGKVRERRSGETFYGDMLNFFELPRVEFRVEPFVNFPALEQKFDLLTSLNPSFYKYTDEKELWGLKEWDFFIDDLRENVLSEDGRMFLWLTRNASYSGPQVSDPEFVEFMQSKGATVDEGRSILMFGQF